MARPTRRPAYRRGTTVRLTPRARSEPRSPAVLVLGGVALVAAGALLATAILTSGFGVFGGGGPAGPGGPAGTPSASGPTALPAGTYQSRLFQPAVRFSLPDGWWIAADSPGYLALQPVDSDLIGIHLFRDPLAASQDAACPSTADPAVGNLSSDLATWIRGRPGLAASKPRLADVGGLRGVEIDLEIAADWTQSCPFANGLPAVPLFVEPDAGLRWVVAGSERLRLSLLDAPSGGTVVVDVDAFEGQLMDDLVSRAGPIVASMSFSAAEATAPGSSGSPPSGSP